MAESKIIPTQAIPLTGLSAVNGSIVSNGSYRLGNVVVINIEYKCTSDVSQWASFLGGVPAPISVTPIQAQNHTFAKDTSPTCYVAGNTIVRTSAGNMTSGSTYLISGVYITSE